MRRSGRGAARGLAAALLIAAGRAGPAWPASPPNAALPPAALGAAPGAGPADPPAPDTPAGKPADGKPADGKPAERRVSLSLAATFGTSGKPIRTGLVWRVFADRTGDAQSLSLVAKSNAAAPSFTLPPGGYTIHVAYGYASASRRVSLAGADATERVPIAAGALRLGGAIGATPVPAERLAFRIYQPIGNDSEGRMVAADVKAGDLVTLPEGTYHVVSTYGESNATVRADLKVEAGQVTEAVMNHHAATVTLKLVASLGGEAFAGTVFTVLTPGGDVIREAIGAFPTVTLSEGDYMLIARHDGAVFSRDFKVESGLDRDIEVVGR